MCPRCNAYRISTIIGTGLCEACSYCDNCRDYIMTKDSDGTFTSRRCQFCKCVKCGSTQATRRNIPQPANEYEILVGRQKIKTEAMCDKCFKEVFNGKMCRVCNANFPTIMLRGHKKPTVCVNCVFGGLPDGSGRRTHYCYFCTQKATGTLLHWVVCKEHKAMNSCAQGNCTPGTLCRRCETRNTENKRILALRNTVTLTQYQHELDEGGECYRDCRACADVRVGEILFNSPLTFWPAGDRPNPPLGLSERRMNKSKRYLSVEIEVAGLNRPQRKDLLIGVVRKWQGSIVHDGSLPAGGFEINSAPAAGDYFVRQVDEICTALRDAEAFPNNKCGLHVHADARDYSYNDLRRLFLYYEKVEPVLIQMQPYTRGMQNVYCKPVGKQLADAVRNLTLPEFFKKQKGMRELKKGVMGAVYQRDGRPIQMERPPRTDHYARDYGTPHYHGMGVHSWFFRGTIELRFHGGTIVARKIVDWATLWAQLMDRALSLSEAEIAAITDPKAEVVGVAPTMRAKAYVLARLDSYANEYKAKGVKTV